MVSRILSLECVLHIIMGMHLLHINSVLHLNTLKLRGLIELLTSAELLNDTGLIEFTFEFLNGAFDILAFFYGYYDHCMTPPLALRFADV